MFLFFLDLSGRSKLRGPSTDWCSIGAGSPGCSDVCIADREKNGRMLRVRETREVSRGLGEKGQECSPTSNSVVPVPGPV